MEQESVNLTIESPYPGSQNLRFGDCSETIPPKLNAVTESFFRNEPVCQFYGMPESGIPA
jgi:hypothetical protein